MALDAMTPATDPDASPAPHGIARIAPGGVVLSAAEQRQRRRRSIITALVLGAVALGIWAMVVIRWSAMMSAMHG